MRIKKPNRRTNQSSSLNLATNAFRYLRLSSLLLFLSILAFVFLPTIVSEANAENASVAKGAESNEVSFFS